MRHHISLINISERVKLDLFDYLFIKLEGNYSNKGGEKMYRIEGAYETYLFKNDI